MRWGQQWRFSGTSRIGFRGGMRLGSGYYGGASGDGGGTGWLTGS